MIVCADLIGGEACDICENRDLARKSKGGVRLCDDCLVPLSEDSAGGSGYESQTSDHSHLESLNGGGMARRPMRRILCTPCYRLDFSKKYPMETVPV